MSDIPVGRITQLNNVPASPTRSHVARTMVPHSVMQSQIDAAVIAAVAAERERCARIADEEQECGWRCDCGQDHSANIAAKIRSGEMSKLADILSGGAKSERRRQVELP